MKKNKKNPTKHVINSQRDKEKYGSRKKAEKRKRGHSEKRKKLLEIKNINFKEKLTEGLKDKGEQKN